MTSPSTKSRLEGYKRELAKAGIAFEEELVTVADYSQQKAEIATLTLANLPRRPTAIFTFSDEMGMSCISTLLNLGLKIPQDISVMGFDNVSYSQYCYPTLSTIAQPMTEIGVACMELLLPQLNGEKMQGVTRILPHKLIVRQSTGPVGQ
jgi:LacI family repressor for deo operon, udp, cdd, tsx, nupC, and nupG